MSDVSLDAATFFKRAGKIFSAWEVSAVVSYHVTKLIIVPSRDFCLALHFHHLS
jgi:hypothetical protein